MRKLGSGLDRDSVPSNGGRDFLTVNAALDFAAITVAALGREALFSWAFKVTAATDRGMVEANQIFSGLKADLMTQITR